MEGVTTNVIERKTGSELTAAVSAGATTLTVLNPDEFDADAGKLTIGAETIAYTIDTITGVATLGSALANSYPEGEPVYVSPVFIERIAHFRETGSEEELQALVPYGLYERLDVGVRDDEGELIEADLVGDELVVRDVIGQPPTIDSRFLGGVQMITGTTAISAIGGSPNADSDEINPQIVMPDDVTPAELATSGDGYVVTANANQFAAQGTPKCVVTVKPGSTPGTFVLTAHRDDESNWGFADVVYVYWFAVRTTVHIGSARRTIRIS